MTRSEFEEKLAHRGKGLSGYLTKDTAIQAFGRWVREPSLRREEGWVPFVTKDSTGHPISIAYVKNVALPNGTVLNGYISEEGRAILQVTHRQPQVPFDRA